jgi:hypothetical protein
MVSASRAEQKNFLAEENRFLRNSLQEKRNTFSKHMDKKVKKRARFVHLKTSKKSFPLLK